MRHASAIPLLLMAALAAAQAPPPPRTSPADDAADILWAKQTHTGLCGRAMDAIADALTAEERETLHREGALYHNGVLLLNLPLTVPESTGMPTVSCDLRVELAGFLERAIQQRTQAGDAEFAARHSQLIVETARRLWFSSAFAEAQSGPHGRYNLLVQPALKEAHVASLVAALLREHGFTPDLVWAMLERPLPKLRPVLVEQLRIAEQTHYVHDHIYALALLHHLGDRTALPALRRLRASDQLSNFESEFLPKLVAHLEAGRRLTFADLEPMELYNER